MSWLPKSRKARMRLTAVAVAAPVLAAAVGLSLWAMGDAVVFFYGPSQAKAEGVPPGRTVRIGGLVQAGSVEKRPDGRVAFTVTDNVAATRIHYHGDLPDLFREGQGIVAQGAFTPAGDFEADEVLAKHDETYMPREVAEALKKSGEWRPETGAPPPVRPAFQPASSSAR
jgi:cytochrome c-type biogenesis protein CcmE